jgi:hypothetical protein
MKYQRLLPILGLTLLLGSTSIFADVKKEERSQVSFAGMLGKMVNFFGGKSAREGVVSTVAVSGDRKMTTNGDSTGQIVDLREEKIYDLDLRKKTYKVMTFEELRQKMREAEAKAKEEAAKQPKEDQPPPQNQGKEFDVDFDVKSTGQTKAINGFDTREVVATITVREKGKKLEQSGGIIMTVDTWLTKTVSLKEIADFDRRFFEKLAGPVMMAEAQQMATAMVMYPGLREAFGRLSKADFEGTAILSTTTVDAVRSEEQMQQQKQSSAAQSGGSSVPTSVGGAIGGFMRRRAQQKEEASPASPRTTFMTINNEILKITTAATAADVALPAGFKPN